MKDIYEFLVDSMIATNEWDHIRYNISEVIKSCDYEEAGDFFLKTELPFFSWFRREIKYKLEKAGFKKEIIEDEKEFKTLVHIINIEQGRTFSSHRWDVNPPYGFPSGTYTISDDNHIMWIKPEIEAAILTLESIKILKELLVTDGVVNKEAVKVYLRSLELIINLSRTGNLPDILKAETSKQENRQGKVDVWEQVIYMAIEKILDKEPTRNIDKWTLGYVMMKFDIINKKNHIYDSFAVYREAKDSKWGIRIESLVGKKQKKFYKKRSLQKFIDEYKRTHPKVTS